MQNNSLSKIRHIIFSKNDAKTKKQSLIEFSKNTKDMDKLSLQVTKKIIKKLDKNSTTPFVCNDFNFENVYEIQNYFYKYSKKANFSLEDICLTIKANKITTFIGPSGSGKSTLLRSLNKISFEGTKAASLGKIFYSGYDILQNIIPDELLRSEVGMIFQRPTPFPLSIYENLAFPLRCHGVKDEKAIEQIVISSLKEVGLYNEVKNNLQTSALELSGGQQQRLCIARAICIRPKIILMDEPTSSLDPIATAVIENLILKLKKEYTIILVSHSMHQTQRVSDDVVMLYKGKIIEVNNVKEFFTNPKHEVTKKYLEGSL
ncbi:phosphate ABC transporter ATP-binding protein [Metamycoplasma arthritidis]|uniref:Phosphate ABC transporter ATP-binding protein n=1 Tax=Metamycoplasma arthritidis (strain 158L3-1) TaxID=243272 RepID=B3PNI0_META1|nr:phosphate ABC transporter ATP-binding protein [Metamycoplasma arthritidis]ACF07582.1 phosphate ABC transporter ATP-binding protein [Metamycoplasma arthritidis 158L3-1]VEU79090.1 phosphate ABC transporter ATP-binding protein [Metamycoplasma arthritidis]